MSFVRSLVTVVVNVPNLQWQETVLWFRSECQLILLVYSGTQGVLWELSSIVERLDPSKLIICITGEGKISLKKRNWTSEVTERPI
jgi:hypothetical protein